VRFDYSQRTVGYGMRLTMRQTKATLCRHNREILECKIQEMRRNEKTMRVYSFNKLWFESDALEIDSQKNAIFVKSAKFV